jgi:hypothetical protein
VDTLVANNVSNRQVHVFFNGEAWDLGFDDLDVGMMSADADIRNKAAEALSVPPVKLASFVVDRNHETEDISLRASAVFGIS